MQIRFENLEALPEWRYLMSAIREVVKSVDEDIEVRAKNGEPVEYFIGFKAALSQFEDLAENLVGKERQLDA